MAAEPRTCALCTCALGIYALCACALCLPASCILGLESCVLFLRSSTSVENPLQISSFMQNKANLPDDKMNVTTFLTKDYENKITLGLRKTNPIQSQTKPICRMTK